MKPNEAAFEEYVAGWLVEHGGYAELKGPGQSTPSAFDPVAGIDTEDMFAFIGATQAEAWDRLKQLHGGLPAGDKAGRISLALAPSHADTVYALVSDPLGKEVLGFYRSRDRGENRKAFWTRIGSAWAHQDGKGFNVQLEVAPLDGRITLRVASEKKE